MKTKLGIKSRVFLSFWIFTIIIVNIFAYLLYFFVSDNIKTNTNKSIINEFETIKTFIDLQSSNIFSLPKYEVEKINNLGFYFYIGNNDNKLQKKYKLGFTINNKNTLFRGDYKGYNIIIGKNTKDFNNFKHSLIEILILLNIFLVISIALFSYFITKFSLKPLLNLSNFLNNYKSESNKKLLKNNYGNTEIGILTNSINHFIENNNNTLESQINFIQDVNHELKTPLMQIDSNIELIEDKIEKYLNNKKDNKIKIRFESIKKSTNNISEILTNLGFILRGEKTIKNKENINLYNYFLLLISKYDSLVNEKNIKIKIVKNYDLKIQNSTYYLDRLFGNILSNAIFYNKGNNNIIITINKNNIEIKDEGIGIEKEELNKIFSRFYRNKNSGLYYENGNGLGLVIVQKITNMFGWRINITSELGKGTNMIIEV